MNLNSFNPYFNHHSYHIFFMNLANPLKIGIIISLREKGKNVREITDNLHMEQSKISHALASLRKCHIVKIKQEGKHRIYYLNKKTIVPMFNILDKHANIYCPNKCNASEDCGCEECRK